MKTNLYLSTTFIATAFCLLTPAAFAGQGTASYLDFDGTNPGFGTPSDTSETATFWSTSAAGTAATTARPSGTQLTIGAVATDFAGSGPFVINLDGGGNLQGVIINSTNANVTFTGTANTHNNSGPNTWSVTNFATLTVNDSRQTFADSVKGLNWNNVAVTFQGGGTFNFATPLGCNSTGLNTENMLPGGVINLQMLPVVSASTYSGGFTLTSGALNFASAGSANAFNGFLAGKNFSINGGVIDNTSGSALTLSVGAGGYSLGGDVMFTGSSSIDFGPAPVALTGTRTITVVANTLTLGPISGTGFGLVKAGAGTLALSGANTYTGGTTLTNGSTIVLTNAGALPNNGPLIVSGSTLDMSRGTSATLSIPAFSVTNSTLTIGSSSTNTTNIVATTLNTAGGTTINIASLPNTNGYPSTYHLIKAGTVNGTLNFALGTLPTANPPYSGFLTNNAASGSVDFVLTNGPAPVRFLKWSGLNGGSPDGTWDVGTTPTWLDVFNAPANFNQADIVTFNDTASGQTSVNMVTTVMPGSLTVSNNTLLYTLGGSDRISGGTALIKQGSGKLILDESGVPNDFTGGVTISAGTLQVGNNDTAGNLPANGNVVDNSALVFARSDNPAFGGVISGTGTVTQNGAGTLTLSGANTFAGAVTVAQGTLQIGNGSALGATNGITTVANGATLDFLANANNIGLEPVVVSGSGVGGGGAIINSSGSATFVGPNIARVTLAGDTIFGGTGRWDLRGSTTSNPNLASLSTGGIARKLTKIGANQVGIVGVSVDPALGDIEIQGGILDIEAATTSLGNTASNLLVDPGATLQMFAITNLLNKVITLGGDGAANTLSATSGSNNIVGPMAITNDCIFNVNNAAVSLTLNNVITGPGKITKVGLGLLTLSGNSPSYAGGLQLNNGSVVVSGTVSNALGMTAGAGKFTLNGTVLGTAGVTNSAGSIVAGSGTSIGLGDISGTLNPGDTNVAGTLTFGGLILEPGANLNYDLGAINTVGSGTNDLIVVNGDLTVNGNSITINALGLLQTGAPYRLFNYTGNLIWNGDLSVNNQGSATYSFAINTNTPGQVNVVVTGGGPPVWNGGSLTDANWNDPANWNGISIFSGSPLYFGGNVRLNNTNDSNLDTPYSDILFIPGAGPFVLNGNPITPTTSIRNSSSNPQTLDLGLDFNTSFTLDGGTSGLVVGGGVTNTAVGTPTTSTLAGTGTLTNLLASVDPTGTNTLAMTSSTANWTLVDNAASALITVPWAFDIRAGTFNFGTASSAPKVSSTTVNGGPQDQEVGVIAGTSGTFNMVNGTLSTVSRLNTALGANSTGIVNQVGGTFNIGQQFQGANGANANELSVVNVSGGTMNIGAGTGQFYVCSRGNGTLTVSGSGALNCGVLDVSRSILSGTLGTVNLNGGTITASRVGTATANSVATSTGSSATFNFNGGTLTASGASTTFIQGSIVAPIIPVGCIVKSGGAIIDDGGFAISILEPLQHDSTLGATRDGGLTKLGTGTLALIATNTYTGGTTVSNGTLAVNGSIGATAVTVATNGALAGTGTIGSNVTVNAGGSLAPAGRGLIGKLTVAGNVTLQAGATNAVDVNKSLASSDLLLATNTTATTITYAGTLAVTNLAGVLAGGDSFKLFSASNYVGSFTLQPAQPAIGLKWDTSQLNVNGTLRITALPRPGITGVIFSGGNVTVGGTNGTAGFSYRVLGSTNVSAPLATWTILGTNVFDGSGNFSFSTSATNAMQFFTIQAL